MLPELLEPSHLSRFFAKFVEIVAGGLATAMCAYLIAHVGDPSSSVTPAPAAVSAGPTAATSLPAQPAAPVAAAAVDGQQRAPQSVNDVQPARKAERAAMAAPVSKDIKTGTSVTRGQKSVEALARAALANVDADRPADAGRPVPAADAPVRRSSTATGTAASAGISAAVEIPQRPADVPPRQADIPPPPAAVDAPPRRIATVDPLPPNAGASPEIAAAEPEPPAVEVKGLISFFKRMPDLLRPGTPSLAGEAPRPPMPVGTAAPE